MPTLLVITVLLPLVGSILLMLAPNWDHKTARQVALVFALATMALALVLVAGFQTGVSGPQFAYRGQPTDLDEEVYGLGWLSIPASTGIRFALGLDGISLWLFALTGLLIITSIFSSWESVHDRAPAHYGMILALETGLLGLFASLDVILFYVFFEFTLIPLFFLIGLYGGPERRRAAVTFFLFTLAGSLLTLLGVIALVVIHARYSPEHTLTFSIPELTRGLAALTWEPWQYRAGHVLTWSSPQVLIFLLLFAGFAVKVPLVPFHTWLPLAHVEAPTAGSILLAGVLLKVGSYGFLRFNLGMTPHGAYFLMPLMGAIAVVGIIYGALTALAQTDVKRLVAYSSVSHMGFIILGLFSLNATGLDGAVIQMINHGLTTGALFACVGVLYERYHTREMSAMSGLWVRLPLLAFFLILAAMGSAALPGLNGYVGEFPILLGMFIRKPLYAILGATGIILGAYYVLWMVQAVIFGPLQEPGGHDHAHEHGHEPAANDAGLDTPATVRPVGWHEIAGLSPLMVLIVLIGVYPKPFFDRISPAVREITARFHEPTAHATSPARPLAQLDQDRAR